MRVGEHARQARLRLIIAVIIAIISFVTYLFSVEENPITGESQRVALSTKEEVALGLQARPEMMARYGNLHPDGRAQVEVDRVGERLLAALNDKLSEQGRSNPYPFEFHLLRDGRTVNAFALPGGQVFITAALFSKLQTEGQLAGILGHEMGHVIARHGAEQLATQNLTYGLAGATGVASGDVDGARLAMAVGQLVNMKYGRDDELESDIWGVRLMADAGYDPRALISVMKILEEASGGGPPEIFSTHPKPANRVGYIRQVIAETFPGGVPDGLEK